MNETDSLPLDKRDMPEEPLPIQRLELRKSVIRIRVADDMDKDCLERLKRFCCPERS